MGKLILLRHGQSEWNKKNVFTGWVDIPLSSQGIEEAFQAGAQLADQPIDCIFTSTLIRGIMTALLVMNRNTLGKVPVVQHPEEEEMFKNWRTCYSDVSKKTLIPVVTAWQLNERMYGQLQGLNKEETKNTFGQEQFQLWRRSYDTAPPEGESLKMTKERTVPYFEKEIFPHVLEGKNVLVCAHGNSLRSIVMHLDKLNENEVVSLEIETGKPLIYKYKDGHFFK